MSISLVGGIWGSAEAYLGERVHLRDLVFEHFVDCWAQASVKYGA